MKNVFADFAGPVFKRGFSPFNYMKFNLTRCLVNGNIALRKRCYMKSDSAATLLYKLHTFLGYPSP